MGNNKNIEQMIKERFFLEMNTKYNISDTESVYRKEVDASLLEDFYSLGNQCNELMEKVTVNGNK